MEKARRAKYTLEFKQEAVRLVESGQTLAAAARGLGLVDQTLHNWVQAERQGKLKGAEKKAVSAEQMEISRLRAENRHPYKKLPVEPIGSNRQTLFLHQALGCVASRVRTHGAPR